MNKVFKLSKGDSIMLHLKYHVAFCRYMLCFCVVTISGCVVGPNYQPPQANVPPAWTGTIASTGNTSAQTNLVKWWTAFNDPNLTSLIDRAIKSNLDLQQAEARLLQARAAHGVITGQQWPTVDVTGSETRSRATTSQKSNLFKAGLDAAWELDIFGGIRRNVEAANADVNAALEDQRDTLVTLTAEVALNYIELRGYQQEIVIAQNNLKAQQHSAELTRKRLEGGFVSSLDTANADALLATTASQIPTLETSAQQTIYNLSVLLGREPAALLEELSPSFSIPTTPPEVPVGLPSELLRRRPDIRRAEAQIHAATARIGVATADLFPKFNLTGLISLQSSNLNSGMNWENRIWSYGPSIDWQIFNAGSVKSNVEVKKALEKQALLTYQQTVLTALKDVENALIAYTKEQERRKALLDAAAANRKALDIATKLYTQGQTDFLNVLDAQRSLYSSEDSLVQSTRNLSTDLVALYKALGGGWDSDK
jgi:outer membrane protein, multidrug efflux system